MPGLVLADIVAVGVTGIEVVVVGRVRRTRPISPLRLSSTAAPAGSKQIEPGKLEL